MIYSDSSTEIDKIYDCCEIESCDGDRAYTLIIEPIICVQVLQSFPGHNVDEVCKYRNIYDHTYLMLIIILYIYT